MVLQKLVQKKLSQKFYDFMETSNANEIMKKYMDL